MFLRHNLLDRVLLQYFFHSLSPRNKEIINGIAGGALVGNPFGVVKVLLEKIVRTKYIEMYQEPRGQRVSPPLIRMRSLRRSLLKEENK